MLAVDGRGGTPSSMHYLKVPRRDLVEVIVALPAGRLRGRVVAATGEPASKVRVWVDREGAWNPTTLGMNRALSTDEEGRFEFTGLAAGGWSVRARGTRTRSGLKLARDEVIDDIELRQEAHGVVRGVVRAPDGSPLGQVPVFARDERGRWVDHFASVRSRPGNGEFVWASLPAGDYTFVARYEQAISAESEPVRVAPGAEATVELRLAPGVTLFVALTDRNGESVAASFHVTDQHGRSFESLQSPYDLEVFLQIGHRPSARILGPLPPGVYTVTARAHDGRAMQGSLTIDSSPGSLVLRRELLLRLP